METITTKKTKATYFSELYDLVDAATFEDADYKADMLDFITKQIDILEARKAAAAKRAAEKKAESDALTDEILAKIGDEFITVDEIVEALDNEEVTRNKVTARLGKLVKQGVIVKEAIKVDSNKRMAYKLASVADDE